MKTRILLVMLGILVSTAYSQTILTVSPSSGTQGQTLGVTISGQNTHFGQGTSTTSVWFQQGSSTVYSSSNTYTSGTQMTSQFYLPYSLPTGWYNTRVYNSLDGYLVKSSSFYLSAGASPPSLISVNPTQAIQGQTLSVTISGQNTHFGQGTSTTSIWFNQASTVIYPVSYTFPTTTQANCQFTFQNTHPTGYYTVNVNNSLDGLLTIPNGFQLLVNPNPPVITTINPNSAQQGQSLTVSISGNYTHFSQVTGTTSIWFRQGSGTLIFPDNLSIVNDQALNVHFNFLYAHPVGLYDVYVADPTDGQLIMNNGFNLIAGPNPPVVDSISNDTLLAGDPAFLHIEGINTHFLSGAGLYFYFTSAKSMFGGSISAILSETQMNIIASPPLSASLGWYNLIIINNKDGQVIYPHAIYLSSTYIGVKKISPDPEMRLFPNPGKGLFYLSTTTNPSEIERLAIYDFSGRLMRLMSPVFNGNVIPIDLGDMPGGVYFLRVETYSGQFILKLILY
jgi:hypothetical protein